MQKRKNSHAGEEGRVTPTRNLRSEVWGCIPWKHKVGERVGRFCDEWMEPIGDMGEPNPKKEALEQHFHARIQSISGLDFDEDPIPAPDGGWGTLFCLEILEHVFNPLLFLKHMKASLKPGGILYISTPYRPHFLWTEHHYHEIDDMRIHWLFERAGLDVVKEERYRLFRGWRWHLKGVRPLLRLMTFGRMYKLKKTDERDRPVR